MPKKDLNQLAKSIVAQATCEEEFEPSTKNAAAVALGRLGGKARAARMSKEEIAASAKKANAARWPKKPVAEAAVEGAPPKVQTRRGVIRPKED